MEPAAAKRVAELAEVPFAWLALGVGHPDDFYGELDSTDPYEERMYAIALARKEGLVPESVISSTRARTGPEYEGRPRWFWRELLLKRALIQARTASESGAYSKSEPEPESGVELR